MSAFSPAFLRGDATALTFLPDSFRHAASRAQSVQKAATRAVALPVIAALRSQARGAARGGSLDALAKPGTVVVVTGQQVGLFLGPLYSFYKAATAVSVARALEKETGVRCVPVFWLQSEDHDFEEIDHVVVHGRDGELTSLRLASHELNARASISAAKLGPGIDAVLSALGDSLEALASRDEVLELFSRHYKSNATWVGAFAGVLSELFEELVLVDPAMK